MTFISIGASIGNLDYTILLCRDLAATRRFYLEVMKFALAADMPSWVSFRVGSSLLTLRPRGPWVNWHDGPLEQNTACVQLAFRVAPGAIAGCHRELLAHNVEIVDGPRDIGGSWNHRALFFRDPEGNIVEIYAEL